MKKICFIFALAIMAAGTVHAQKHFTRAGKIAFFSDAVVEKIEAHNNSATSVLDLDARRMEFAVLIKGFQFEKALMQEHFNENYMESDKFPKATFKGTLTDDSKVNWSKDGSYPVTVAGDLTIHGQTKAVRIPATFSVKGGKISGVSEFKVAVADYGITIPAVVRENIAKEITIRVAADYQLLNQ